MILNSPRAVEMSVFVARAFIQLRNVLASDAALALKVTKLERGQESLNGAVIGIWKTLREMRTVPETRAIGFFELKEQK